MSLPAASKQPVNTSEACPVAPPNTNITIGAAVVKDNDATESPKNFNLSLAQLHLVP